MSDIEPIKPVKPPPSPDFGAALLERARAYLDVPVTFDAGVRGLQPHESWSAFAVSQWIREAVNKDLAVPRSAMEIWGLFDLAKRIRHAGDISHHQVEPGMLMFWRRPPVSWAGEVGIVDEVLEDGVHVQVIVVESGSEQPKVERRLRRLDDPLLLGIAWV